MKREIGGRLFYSRKGLIKEIGIAERTLGDWKTKGIETTNFNGEIYYQYDSIPEQSRKRIDEHENFAALLYLAEGFENGYVQHLPTYRAINNKPQIYEKYARKCPLGTHYRIDPPPAT